MTAEKIPRFAREDGLRSPAVPPSIRPAVHRSRYQLNWISVLAYANRPLYPNGDAAAQGNVPKLLL